MKPTLPGITREGWRHPRGCLGPPLNQGGQRFPRLARTPPKAVLRACSRRPRACRAAVTRADRVWTGDQLAVPRDSAGAGSASGGSRSWLAWPGVHRGRVGVIWKGWDRPGEGNCWASGPTTPSFRSQTSQAWKRNRDSEVDCHKPAPRWRYLSPAVQQRSPLLPGLPKPAAATRAPPGVEVGQAASGFLVLRLGFTAAYSRGEYGEGEGGSVAGDAPPGPAAEDGKLHTHRCPSAQRRGGADRELDRAAEHDQPAREELLVSFRYRRVKFWLDQFTRGRPTLPPPPAATAAAAQPEGISACADTKSVVKLHPNV